MCRQFRGFKSICQFIISKLFLVVAFFSFSVPWDFVVQYYGKNISTQDLLIKLNMTSAPFDVANICPSWKHSCESVCPVHGNEAVERSTEKPCYCDKLCLEVGDCCYDYFLRLVNKGLIRPEC